MKKQLRFCIGVLLIFSASDLSAQLSAQCHPASARIDLDINNVRAAIMTGGDMWWDLSNPVYEIPKGSRKNSMFCGGMWMGGLDPMGSLHVSAMTYRQMGNDYWPGPLDTISGGIVDSTCQDYDQLWKIDRADVESFVANRNDPNYVIPEAILTWPGNGNTARGNARFLAPFVDVDGDLVYDATRGDYPAFALNGQNNCDYNLLGDQAIWWVFNDRGNTHSETAGAAFGFEIQGMAFAYRSSNDKLNDATFYRYKVINRSTSQYDQMWLGLFSDYDLGDAFDDYVGCDVGRGLGYCYNGDVNDGATAQAVAGTYGAHPPAIGVDFLQGPLAYSNDGIDNDRDSVTDESGERIIQASCTFYNGDFSARGNPEIGPHYYSYLHHCWKDDSPLTYGGTGYGGSLPCQFIYPGNSDPFGWGTGGVPQSPWDEITSGNLPNDRRQVNSVGPFDMAPGEVEVITVGIPWARDTNGNNLDAVARLQEADDYIQNLFSSCFSIPCVDQGLPEITFTIDGKLAYFTLYAGGTAWSWDFGDGQHSTQKNPSHYYGGPGDYICCVQVTTPCGTLTDCDTIHIADQLVMCGPAMWRIEGMGNGKQEMDFAKETIAEILDSSHALFPMYLPMHGPVKISYEDYDALQDGEYRIAFDTTSMGAHWKMWMVGGTDTAYSDSAIGTGELQRISMWGLGVQAQQVASIGYGNNPDRNGYLASSISFADPSKNWLSGIEDTDYDDAGNWIRGGVKSGTGVCVAEFNDRYNGLNALDPNEDFENMVQGTWGPYRIGAYNPYPAQSSICYPVGPAWFPTPLSAILSNKIENLSNVDVVITADQSKWTRCPVIETGPTWDMNEGAREAFHLRAGLSVDKNGRNVTNGGTSNPNDPNAADYIGAYGMGWFPGYAINLETGERLNMAFGENSTFTSENGRDMLWNPTEQEHTQFGGPLWGGCHYIYVFGHNGDALYTSGVLTGELKDIPRYDAGKAVYTILNSDNTANPELKEVYADAMWMSIPVLAPGHSLFESDVTIRLRVQKPYAKFATSSTPLNRNFPLYGFRVDKNNSGCNLYDHSAIAYPNPFADECVIQFANSGYRNTDLKLYDAQGKLVRVYEDVTADRIVISGAGLNAGMYIWHLQVEGEEEQIGRIILR